MDEKVTTSFIAASMSLIVALVGVVANFLITRLQVQSKINELTQTQLKDIVAKRIEVYPELWRIAQTELSDLEREGKLVNPGWVQDLKRWDKDAKWEPDARWAENLLTKLMSWHQEYGVFLSQASYDAFDRLRAKTEDLAIKCNRAKRGPTIAEFQRLDQAFYQESDGKSPLATHLKNDLGSYKSPSISQEERASAAATA
jgi:hypothetical protein